MNCDMSATWKCVGRGGAAKVKTLPCHCCAIQSSNLAVHNSIRCRRWGCADAAPGVKCYHHRMLDDKTKERMKDQLAVIEDAIVRLIPNLDELMQESLCNQEEDPRAANNKKSLKRTDSIHFNYARSNVKKSDMIDFQDNLIHDLDLRGLDAKGTVRQLRDRLRESMIQEWMYRELKRSIAHGVELNADGAYFVVMDAVPCSLHMENRVGLKLITMLLIEGLKSADLGSIHSHLTSKAGRIKAYMESIHRIMNLEILGSELSPNQWKVPFDSKTNTIGTLCLENTKTRKVVKKMSLLIDVCVSSPQRCNDWKECVDHYLLALEILGKRSDLSDDEIRLFQGRIDAFHGIWVRLHGSDGITNYIHLLSSGHISDYLFHWRNLYVHSQQGWEAFNSLLKTFYFRRTQRGGTSNHGLGSKSKIVPIARWMARRVMWMCGISFAEMEQHLSNEDVSVLDGDEEEQIHV